jgi:hypothetical protein
MTFTLSRAKASPRCRHFDARDFSSTKQTRLNDPFTRLNGAKSFAGLILNHNFLPNPEVSHV